MNNVMQVDPSIFKAPQRKSTVDTVTEKIRELLLTKQLRPGDRLPTEMELAASLSVSRGSVREAMKILASFGVLEIRRGDGTYVSNSMSRILFDHLLFQLIANDADKRKLIELRELIETGLVKPVLKNATPQDIEDLSSAYKEMEDMRKSGVEDPRAFAQCDIAFHHALGRAAHNELIEKIYAFTMELFSQSIERTHSIAGRELGKHALVLHRNILNAVKNKDQAQALAAIHKSIEIWVELSS